MKDKEIKMSNRGLLIIVVVLLAGIFAIVAVESTKKSPSEEMADSFGEFTEEIGDEFEDATKD
jgi:NADH:ubiquinone oxidoreductase subunit 6 (subunit J)